MRRIFCLASVLLAVGCGQRAVPAPSGTDSPRPTIHIRQIETAPGHQFELAGPGVDQAGRERFTVHVVGPDGPSELAMVGEYAAEPGRVTFTPRYPLAPGVRYRAVYRSPRLAEPLTAEIELPRPKLEATTVIEQVYPSGNLLPENLLRFYVQFSAPMGRGNVYQHVRLIDDKGQAVELPFLELDEEFWDPEQKRFTLFFDPGRIKRGVKPREDLGPALEAGRSYRLVIDRNWLDARGAPLKEGYVKRFQVVAADDRSPDPQTWKLEPPPAGSREPLAVRFPEPLDHGMLQRLLVVLGPDGQRLAGRIDVSDEETRWRFTPDQAWQAGGYQLQVATTLEDRAGNSIERLFEVDVFSPIQKKVEPGQVKVPFTIRNGK